MARISLPDRDSPGRHNAPGHKSKSDKNAKINSENDSAYGVLAMKSKQLLTGLVLALVIPMAQAAPIYSQTVLDDGSSFGTFSSLDGGNQIADNFSLGYQYSVTGLTWWGSYFDSDVADSFTVRLFSDDGGQPLENADILDSNSLAVNQTTVLGATDYYGQQIYRYEVSLNVLLGPGDFYLSIMNDAADPYGEWFWADAASGDQVNWFRVDANEPWTEYPDYDLAFVLNGERVVTEVPEPGTWVLMLLGLFGLLLQTRRQCSAHQFRACHG
jgi:PEP-CTERM motif-containing protein